MDRIKIFIIFIIAIMITGCGKNNYITCYSNISNDLENYNLKSDYKIYYKTSFVTKIEKNEKYISTDINKLNLLEEIKKLEYYNLNDKYGGVTYSIQNTEKQVIVKSIIDLESFNVTQMVKNGEFDKDYVINNKITVNGLKKIYESRGLICRG